MAADPLIYGACIGGCLLLGEADLDDLELVTGADGRVTVAIKDVKH